MKYRNRHTEQEKFEVGQLTAQAVVYLADKEGDLESADPITAAELCADWEQVLTDEEKSKMAQEAADAECLELLMLVVTLGRNKRPYRHLLPRLKELLAKCPGIAKIVSEMSIQ